MFYELELMGLLFLSEIKVLILDNIRYEIIIIIGKNIILKFIGIKQFNAFS